MLIKILFLLTIYIAHGRPFAGMADYGYALLAAYLLLFGILRDRIKPVLVIAGLVCLTLGRFTPQLMIPEQQRLLMDNQRNFIAPGQFLEDASKYPYFLTADGYVQGYPNKRLVQTIDIDQGLVSLRSGWMNRPEYNFYPPVSPHVRKDLPFVVSYEIIPRMAGMTLSLEGWLVFEKEGRLKIHDPAIKTLQLQNTHVGSTLTGFGGQWNARGYHNLKIKLEKTLPYQLYDAVRSGCFLSGMALLFFGLFSIQPTVNFGLQSLLLFLSAFSFVIYFSPVLRWGILAKGGMDGIRHDGFSYCMLEKWAAGDWREALLSPERVFYFMPGMRYVRFVEMLLFGDAYILQVCLLIFAPVIFYRFFTVFLCRAAALTLTLLAFAYLFNGIGLSFKLYVKTLLDLYGEGFAYALLLIAVTMLAKSIQKTGWGAVAFFLLAISISIRPNLVVFAGILSGIHLFTATFSPLSWSSRFITLFGLMPVLLIPAHNIWGGEFVLLTKAAQIPENLPLSPGLYYQAITHFLGKNEAFKETGRFMAHFQTLYPQYVIAWGGCLWLSFKGQTPIVQSLALATFAGLSMHFFYLPDIRYLHPYLTMAIVLSLSQILRLRTKDIL